MSVRLYLAVMFLGFHVNSALVWNFPAHHPRSWQRHIRFIFSSPGG